MAVIQCACCCVVLKRTADDSRTVVLDVCRECRRIHKENVKAGVYLKAEATK